MKRAIDRFGVAARQAFQQDRRIDGVWRQGGQAAASNQSACESGAVSQRYRPKAACPVLPGWSAGWIQQIQFTREWERKSWAESAQSLQPVGQEFKTVTELNRYRKSLASAA